MKEKTLVASCLGNNWPVVHVSRWSGGYIKFWVNYDAAVEWVCIGIADEYPA